jgi:hypothetical protein
MHHLEAGMTDTASPVAIEQYQPPKPAPAPKDEFANVQRQAAVLAKTNMVPTPYRGRPDDILAAWLYGRELGFQLMQAVNNLDVIDGRPALRAAAMAGLVNQSGRGKLEYLENTATKATVRGTRKDTGATLTFTWTIDMARRAKLLNKANWEHYPEAMLLSRAISQVCRTLFPDVLRGMVYSSEELVDMTDVQQLPGTPPPATNDAGEAVADQAPPDPALTPDERDYLKRLFGDPVDPNDLRKGWTAGTLDQLRTAIDQVVAGGLARVDKLSDLRRSHYDAIKALVAAQGSTSEVIDDEGSLT